MAPASVVQETDHLGLATTFPAGQNRPRHAISAEVAEWQTRRTQNPVLARGCGFKSHLRYYRLTTIRRDRGAVIAPVEFARQQSLGLAGEPDRPSTGLGEVRDRQSFAVL